MADQSKIEWDLVNVSTRGSAAPRSSAGCTHCYAEALTRRYGWTEWGPRGERKRTSPANWKKPHTWNRAAEREGVRHRVFCRELGRCVRPPSPGGVARRSVRDDPGYAVAGLAAFDQAAPEYPRDVARRLG